MTIKIDNARVENSIGPVWAVKYYGEIIHVTAPTQRDARRIVAELHPTKLKGGKVNGRYTENPVQLSPFTTTIHNRDIK